MSDKHPELAVVLEAFTKTRGNRKLYEEEIETLAHWCSDYIAKHALFGLMEKQLIVLDIVGGELLFKISATGEEYANSKKERVQEPVTAPVDPLKEGTLAARVVEVLGLAGDNMPTDGEAFTAKLASVCDVNPGAVCLALKYLKDQGIIEKL